MKILGFRSKKNWKMFSASLVYGFIALFIIIAIIDPSSEEVAGDVEAKDPIAKVEEEATEEVEEPVVEETPEEPKVEDSLTVSQKNAIRKAEDYLDYTAFSKSGLVEQLEYEGFSNEEATFASENIEVNWREQAVLKAEDYLNYSAFSRSGLIDQLLYDGHSQEDANYAVDQVGL